MTYKLLLDFKKTSSAPKTKVSGTFFNFCVQPYLEMSKTWEKIMIGRNLIFKIWNVFRKRLRYPLNPDFILYLRRVSGLYKYLYNFRYHIFKQVQFGPYHAFLRLNIKNRSEFWFLIIYINQLIFSEASELLKPYSIKFIEIPSHHTVGSLGQ